MNEPEWTGKVLDWLSNGEVGVSSNAMAMASLSRVPHPVFDTMHPLDPSDFRRCLLLARQIPEAKTVGAKLLAELDKFKWKQIYEHWDEIEASLVSELGDDLNHGTCPLTYDLMQSLGTWCMTNRPS